MLQVYGQMCVRVGKGLKSRISEHSQEETLKHVRGWVHVAR